VPVARAVVPRNRFTEQFCQQNVGHRLKNRRRGVLQNIRYSEADLTVAPANEVVYSCEAAELHSERRRWFPRSKTAV